MSIPPQGVPTGNHDADPTGMRDLLSSLPEPGPMPDDLADRICASLEREQGLRGAQQPWDSHARVHDLARERAHRRPQQWILAAAAVLAVGVIGTVVFDQVLDSQGSADSAAANVPTPQREESGGDSADAQVEEGSAADSDEDAFADDVDPDRANAESEAQGGGDDSADSDLGAADSLAQDALEGVGDDVFALGARSLLDVASGQSAEDSADLALALPLDLSDVQPLDEDELDNCIAAAGMQPAERTWVGAPTAISGEEVVIVGSTGPNEPQQAWALDQTCPDNADAAVLRGPVSLP